MCHCWREAGKRVWVEMAMQWISERGRWEHSRDEHSGEEDTALRSNSQGMEEMKDVIETTGK